MTTSRPTPPRPPVIRIWAFFLYKDSSGPESRPIINTILVWMEIDQYLRLVPRSPNTYSRAHRFCIWTTRDIVPRARKKPRHIWSKTRRFSVECRRSWEHGSVRHRKVWKRIITVRIAIYGILYPKVIGLCSARLFFLTSYNDLVCKNSQDISALILWMWISDVFLYFTLLKKQSFLLHSSAVSVYIAAFDVSWFFRFYILFKERCETMRSATTTLTNRILKIYCGEFGRMLIWDLTIRNTYEIRRQLCSAR